MPTHAIPQPLHPRYSTRPFPPYRFVLGENPHPTVDPDGHSYGKEENPEVLTLQNWSTHETYLYGIDLYNYAYWWETHEVLEALWGQFPRGSRESDFLQGLIKIAAGFYKWHLRDIKGVQLHYAGGTELLNKAKGSSPMYMGIDLPEYLRRLAAHFESVGAQRAVPQQEAQPAVWPDPLAKYPFIILRL